MSDVSADAEELLQRAVRLLDRWKTEVTSWSVTYGLKDDTFKLMQEYTKRQAEKRNDLQSL
jgi:hypothetical protein